MAKMFFSFIELVLQGDGWQEELPPFNKQDLAQHHLANARVWRASGQGCELLLVEPEIVVRRFAMKIDSVAVIQGSTVEIEKTSVVQELTVEDGLLTSGKERFRVT